MATNISGTLGVDKINSALIATTAEAQAGTNNTKLMTPLRVADVALGVGQTWQNVTTSRVSGTTYTNTTSKPIQVSITRSMSASNSHVLTIDGVTVGSFGNPFGDRAVRVCLSGIVPVNGTYSVSGAGTINFWSELR